VTLQSSNFAAEFGQVQGGLVNFTTRSGTNQFHGAAYDFNTNEFMNAGRPFTSDGRGHLIRPRQRNNDYGFSVGGPVWIPKLYNGRNRTFFFFNFDQFRNKSTVSGAAATVRYCFLAIPSLVRISVTTACFLSSVSFKPSTWNASSQLYLSSVCFQVGVLTIFASTSVQYALA